VVAQGEGAAAALTGLQESAVRTGKFVVPTDDAIRQAGGTAVLTLSRCCRRASANAETALSQLRGELAPAALGSTTWAVGGESAESVDYGNNQRDKLPYVIAFVLALTLVMMAFTFRSVAIAVVTTLLNLASVGACFGVLALVFQHSWRKGSWASRQPGSWCPGFPCSCS
jgi:RND superfamily putative drug exporter